jgi:hypothetical protein
LSAKETGRKMVRGRNTPDTDIDQDDLAAQAPQRRAGLRPDELAPGETNDNGADRDITAAGTAGGGLAAGGMGGTNAGDGSADDVELENAFGSGIFDDATDPPIEIPEYEAGRAGGAVGGKPAGKRVKPRSRRKPK